MIAGGKLVLDRWNQMPWPFPPGLTAEATISSMLRKLLRLLHSQGLTTSAWPTFSSDCAVGPPGLLDGTLLADPAAYSAAAVRAVHRTPVGNGVLVLALDDVRHGVGHVW